MKSEPFAHIDLLKGTLLREQSPARIHPYTEAHDLRYVHHTRCKELTFIFYDALLAAHKKREILPKLLE
jgi:hypothetical protein